MASLVERAAILLSLGILFHLVLQAFFLHDQLCEAISLFQHVFFDVVSLSYLLLQVLIQLLLLQHLIGALVDPVFDGIDVDTFGIIVDLFLLLATFVLLASLLLQRLELVDLLRDQLVGLLQVVFELKHGLVFVLNCLLVGKEILVDM